MEYFTSLSLYDNVYLYFQKDDYGVCGFATDGKTFSREVSANIDYLDSKFKIHDVSLFVSDFDYDGRNDIIGILEGEPNSTFLYIYSVYKDKQLLEIELLDYSINEYKFSWIDYCILNGRRGIRIKVRGEALTKQEYFYLVGDIDNYNVFHGKKDNFAFFYWNPTEQNYILDKSLTQDKLQNAYCPEDYFSYNGLTFSKLDSKLKDTDLKDLDKSQLRLMRNAVYARHGRIFKSVDLQSLWECYTWYKKNQNYSDSLLTDIDKYNIELIQKYETKIQ